MCVCVCVCGYLCMPDSAVLALVFEVIMSQRHWVKAPLQTQHIYITQTTVFVCVFVSACVHMYLYYIMYACMCCMSLIMRLYLYACEYLRLCFGVHLHTVAVLHLEGFEHQRRLSYSTVTKTTCRYAKICSCKAAV